MTVAEAILAARLHDVEMQPAMGVDIYRGDDRIATYTSSRWRSCVAWAPPELEWMDGDTFIEACRDAAARMALARATAEE